MCDEYDCEYWKAEGCEHWDGNDCRNGERLQAASEYFYEDR